MQSDAHVANIIGKKLQRTDPEADIAACLQKGVAILQHGENIAFNLDGDSCQFTAYKPNEFETIRDVFGLNRDAYIRSVSPDADHYNNSDSSAVPSMRVIGGADAAGKSDAWFLVTPDQQYIAKTCKESDVKLLLKLLEDYTAYVQKHRGTLLPQFLGMYKVERKKTCEVFVIMKNIFSGKGQIMRRYDLKGSTAGRKASDNEKTRGKRGIWKDVDFLNKRGGPLVIDPSRCADYDKLLKTIDEDARWLGAHNLLDYSLLVGLANAPLVPTASAGSNKAQTEPPVARGAVKKLTSEKDTPKADDHVAEASIEEEIQQILSQNDQVYVLSNAGDRDDEPRLAYVGIIDILTEYKCKKMFESRCRTLQYGNVSCKPPAEYEQRFSDFAKHIFAKELDDSHDYEQRWDKKYHKSFLRRLGDFVFCCCAPAAQIQ